MAAKKLTVGAPVLWYGFALNVTALITNDAGQELAVVEETGKLEERNEAHAEILVVRGEQEACGDVIRACAAGMALVSDPDEADVLAAKRATAEAEHAAAAVRIRKLDAVMRESIVRAKLRADLLAYWPEREVWVSEGRILTDAQREAFAKTSGRKPLAREERTALVMLEAVGA